MFTIIQQLKIDKADLVRQLEGLLVDNHRLYEKNNGLCILLNKAINLFEALLKQTGENDEYTVQIRGIRAFLNDNR